MIKIMFCLRRLPTLTREQFQDYWRNKHAPLVMARAKLLGIHRYVQCHTQADATFARFSASRGGHPAFDGIAEIWQGDAGEGSVEERRRASQDRVPRRTLADRPARHRDGRHRRDPGGGG